LGVNGAVEIKVSIIDTRWGLLRETTLRTAQQEEKSNTVTVGIRVINNNL